MPEQNQRTVLLCQDTICLLEHDLVLADGTQIPAGTRVVLLPQTISACILTPDGDSLADAWPTISRSGHTHDEIVDYSEQLTRYANRLTVVEAKLTELETKK